MGNKGKCKFVIATVFAMLFVFVVTGCVENNLNENDTVIVVNKEYEEAHTFLAPCRKERIKRFFSKEFGYWKSSTGKVAVKIYAGIDAAGSGKFVYK